MKHLFENWRGYLNERENRLNLFILVGPPSVGKSTWINNTFKNEKPHIVNRDSVVEKVFNSLGWTYDDAFVAPPEDAQENDVDKKYGTVIKSPPWMTWQPLSFDKVFSANSKVEEIQKQMIAQATSSNKDIVIDMTNMNAAARKRAMEVIKGSEDRYKKIAVVFEFEGAENFIKKVAEKRAEAAKRLGKSKTIPPAAFDRMFKAFEKIDPAEGFDKVVSVDNRGLLQQLANED
jgi:hypothetical protein